MWISNDGGGSNGASHKNRMLNLILIIVGQDFIID